MDWAKMSVEKLFVFVVALIPGSSVLLVVALHRADLWKQFWELNYLGYQSKIGVLAFAAFVAGLTISEAVAFLANFSASFVISFKAAYRKTRNLARGSVPDQQQPQISPWRSLNWRKLLTVYLGHAAPENIDPSQDPQLSNEALWKEWWILLNRLATPKKNSQQMMVENVEVNFGSACLIIMLAFPTTPILQKWWIIGSCLFWMLITGTFWFQQYKNAQNVEYAYYKQMEYLQMRVCKGEQENSRSQ